MILIIDADNNPVNVDAVAPWYAGIFSLLNNFISGIVDIIFTIDPVITLIYIIFSLFKLCNNEFKTIYKQVTILTTKLKLITDDPYELYP